jgi:hypothetical protein
MSIHFASAGRVIGGDKQADTLRARRVARATRGAISINERVGSPGNIAHAARVHRQPRVFSQTVASRRCEHIAPWPTQEHHHGLMSFTKENNHPGCSQQEDRVHV